MKKLLPFLKKLGSNNNRDWFLENKKEYDAARDEFIEFTQQLINNTAKFDKAIGSLAPKDCIFRINRDIRFSKDKSPYKTNMGAALSPGGKKSFVAGYYIHVEPGDKSFVAGGAWMPEPDKLKAIRQEIDYGLKDFEAILKNKDFVKQFGKMENNDEYVLKTPPKGYSADNPAIEYLKHKSFVVSKNLKDSEINSDKLLNEVLESFKTMKPLNDFINKAMGN